MGLLDRIFPKKSEAVLREATSFETLTAYRPKFTDWGGEIYENELVRASIDAIARRFSKMKVEVSGPAKPKLQTKLNKAPNEWSTWSQFLYRTATILFVQNNVIICPVINDTGEMTGIYPVLPSLCSLVAYKDTIYLRLEFRRERGNKEYAAIELDKCAILNRFQYESDFFGEKNLDALKSTMELIHLQDQAIKEGVKSSAYIRFIATLGNFANDEDLAKERARFNAKNLRSSDSGVLLFPNTYKDIRQIESKPFVVDSDQQKLIQENVFNYFGVNEKILQNAADTDAEDAFYAGCLESLAVMVSEKITKMLFTNTEQSNGNVFSVTSNRLENMSTKNKIEFTKAMIDRGIVSIDEVRALFGYDEMPNEQGKKTPIRGEYYFVEEGKPGQQTEITEEEENAEPTE